MRYVTPICALMFLLPLSACSDSDDGPASFDPAEMADMFSGDMSMTLDEEDVENFIAAMADLRKVGAGIEKSLGDSPGDSGDMKQFMTAMGARSEWLEVIDDHDMSQAEFFKIQTNVMKAFAAVMSAGPSGNVQQALQQQRDSLEAMKANMPPEARARMEEGLKAAQSRMAGLMADIPEANLELVRKYKDRIEAALR